MDKDGIHCIATAAFGLESLVKDEIIKLGYRVDRVENGRVHFSGGLDAVIRANLWLRCADRVLLKMGEFEATSFDELFEKTKALPWEDWIPVDGKFPASKITSVKSKLFSKSDGQRIVKKAVVERLKQVYHREWFEETGADYSIHIHILKDQVLLALDTSGSGLHKRGYRRYGNEAPLKETMAAALVMLSKWGPHRYFIDPLCGSGTIVIEAAMIGKNMAPGRNRGFASEAWRDFPKVMWDHYREEAEAAINDRTFRLLGSDIDPASLKQALINARLAGVEDYVAFQRLPVQKLNTSRRYGVIVTNPPYGERLGDEKGVTTLYREMGEVFETLPDWSYFIICGHPDFEKYFGKRATKNRKLYNSMIKTYFYEYFGSLPPKKDRSRAYVLA